MRGMKFQMHKESLFAVLLRSPWWISAGVAVGVFFLARLVVPPVYAAFVPLPFVVIGCMAAWRQLRTPSAKKVAAKVEALRAMPRETLSATLEAAFRREGYEVSRLPGGQPDFEMTRGGRKTLVDFRRWKAKRTGVEALRELDEAVRRREADESIYIAAGEVTDTARAFAAEKRIRLLDGRALAALTGRMYSPRL